MSQFRRLSTRPTPFLFALLCVALFAAPLSAEEKEKPAGPDPIEARVAMNDLSSLENFIKKRKSVDSDLTSYLSVVSDAINNFKLPDQPAEDAAEDVKKIYASAVKRVESDQESFNKKAESAILKCFTLVNLASDKETNERNDVNRAAAKTIGDLAPRLTDDQREKFSKKLVKALDGLEKAKWTVPTTTLDEGFAALGKLAEESSLEWMMENFIHTKNQSAQIDRLNAAHKAMVLFPFAKTDGNLRYEIVKAMNKTYSGTETQAEQTSNDKNVQAAKQFWDRVKVDAIKVLQHFAGESAAREGQAFNRVNDFVEWFRDNKNPKKAPWKLDEPDEDKTDK